MFTDIWQYYKSDLSNIKGVDFMNKYEGNIYNSNTSKVAFNPIYYI